MALHDWNFKLNVLKEGNVKESIEYGSCRKAKSDGGKKFHEPDTKSVVVVNTDGQVYLYLVAGHPEKTENVKSPY
jgi:hypothetical protein